MSQVCIVTEGSFDEQLLKKVLPTNVTEYTEFVVGAGRYSAQSLARTILSFEKVPVALIVDTDTTEPSSVQEQKDFLRTALYEVSSGVTSKVFLAVPEIETILFTNREIFTKIVKREFSDIEWQFALEKPKKFLQSVMGKNYQDTILFKLDTRIIDSIRKHPLISELCKFVYSTIGETVKEKSA